MIEEGIQCPECKRAVVQRQCLTGEMNPIAYRKTQHICPYCGVIMYQTGGGVNWTALVVLMIVFGACALVILTLICNSSQLAARSPNRKCGSPEGAVLPLVKGGVNTPTAKQPLLRSRH